MDPERSRFAAIRMFPYLGSSGKARNGIRRMASTAANARVDRGNIVIQHFMLRSDSTEILYDIEIMSSCYQKFNPF
jgi:hypothetical protein